MAPGLKHVLVLALASGAMSGRSLAQDAEIRAGGNATAQQVNLSKASTGGDARAPTILQSDSTSMLTQIRSQALARGRWQVSGRAIPREGAAALRAQAIQQKLQMRPSGNLNAPGASGVWVSLGPRSLPSDASGSGIQDYGFVSGRATAVAIDMNDPTGSTVFVGGAYAGVWKSTNAGALSVDPSAVTWTPLTDSQATLAIGSIAVKPQLSNPNPANSVVLAGAGETDSSTDSYYGLGILRSTNGGQTWALIPQDSTGTHSFAGLGFSQIAFSTTNPSLVIAAAGATSEGILEGLENPVAANRGIYSSTDAGAHWQATAVVDSGVNISPDSATTVAYNGAAGKFYAAIRAHGFYSSSDGVNWTRLASQPGTRLTAATCPAIELTPSACPLYRAQIAVVPGRAGPSNLGEMYVWFVDANGDDQGIWTSLDGGASWTEISDSGITNCGDVFGGCGTDDATFNLALAAVPNLDATDLYAGAVNIYKCEITAVYPTCNGTGANTFLNLTHAYGCSDIAKVHPGQHGMDFLIANNAVLMYFANDGGIYRSLNGYAGLTTETCGQSNQFDDLNETLGPMTEFVSLAQSATDANILFGGTQDNGAPATASSQSSGAWVNVNAGDNGLVAVNPSNENEWLIAAPPNSISGVNLFRCINGVNCHTQDFENDEVVDSNAVGGDVGPYYLPFLLDPQNSSQLILGTCRIWRGATVGGSYSLLSPDFETNANGSCGGSETNMVRAIAAGGLKDPNGNSQTIYVGTNGEGPLISTTPTGGHVWVTTNADGGPLTWNDVTQQINPHSFPISSIALDSTDPLGKTAYVAIMGFHTSHVWKTTNAGTSWADFTANLPDAPVNALVVDSGASLSNGTVYAGTDVGVFASSTGTANWTEIGPAAGLAGFIPNVAVTSLQVFNSGGLKRLRAATYGRGIWEWNLITTPDFQLNVSNNPLTIFPSQTATFNGTVYALNSYSNNVNLSCTAGATNPPPNCSVSPSAVLPNATGVSFSINASGPIGDYQFNVHAAGTDSFAVTHDLPVTLHVVDFSLGVPSPSTVNVAPGSTSAPISLQVSAFGSFSGAVALSCSNLPAGATCQFQPSATVSPANGSPVAVTLNMVTSFNTGAGSFPVTIVAAVPGAPSKTQNFTLVVSSVPDFAVAISDPSLTTAVGAPGTFNGTLIAINSYNSPVALSCGTNAPPNCRVSPASATPTPSGLPFSVNVSSNVAQTYNFNIVAVGSDPATITHSVPVSFTASGGGTFDFTVGVTPASASVVAGQTANFSLNLNSTTGSFPSNVSFSCAGLPNLAACNFTPSTVGIGSGSTTVNWTIATEGAFTGSSGTVPGTPPGTYTVVITATCGSVQHSAQVSLTVTAGSPGFDFNLGVNPATASISAGDVANFALTVVSTTGSFPDAVSFSCSGLPALARCTFTPLQIVPGANGSQTVSLIISTQGPGTSNSGTVQGTPAGTYNVVVIATSGSMNHVVQISLTVASSSQSFDFSIGVNPVTASVTEGSSTTLSATITSTTGSFPNNVSFSCSNLPALATCSFSPAQIGSGNNTGPQTTALTVSTIAPVAASAITFMPFLSAVPITGLVWIRRKKQRYGRRRGTLLRFLLLAGSLTCFSCGGGLQGNGGGGGSGSPGTPIGNYSISVTATSASITHSVQVSLTVTR
jgi:uncharacterized membrane protein